MQITRDNDKKKTGPSGNGRSRDVGRRSFLKGAASVAAVTAVVPLEPLIGGKESVAEASSINYSAQSRAEASFSYRRTVAHDERIDVGVQPDNGDLSRFTDFSGVYTKALLHDGLGVPNAASFQSFRRALTTGRFADFEDIIQGTPGGGSNSLQNGPQGAFAFDLEGTDSHAIVIPPAPSVASAQTAAEQVEHYWGALLRDVPFTDYASNSIATEAIADLNNLSYVNSGSNNEYPAPVTRQNLFRGQIYPGDGNVMGPYVSQFMVQPTALGVQPLSQQYQTFLPTNGGGADYMINPSVFLSIQNGGNSVG